MLRTSVISICLVGGLANCGANNADNDACDDIVMGPTVDESDLDAAKLLSRSIDPFVASANWREAAGPDIQYALMGAPPSALSIQIERQGELRRSEDDCGVRIQMPARAFVGYGDTTLFEVYGVVTHTVGEDATVFTGEFEALPNEWQFTISQPAEIQRVCYTLSLEFDDDGLLAGEIAGNVLEPIADGEDSSAVSHFFVLADLE